MFLAVYCWWACEVDESPRQNHCWLLYHPLLPRLVGAARSNSCLRTLAWESRNDHTCSAVVFGVPRLLVQYVSNRIVLGFHVPPRLGSPAGFAARPGSDLHSAPVAPLCN